MQLEVVSPQSIEDYVVSHDSNIGPRMEVCFFHKVGFVLLSEVVFQFGVGFQLGIVFQLGFAFQ
jgi:hypothetical protein